MITIARADRPDHQPLIHQIYELRARQLRTAPRDHHAANDMGPVKEPADRPDTVYILVLCEEGTVIAACRINNIVQDQFELCRFDLDLDYAARNGEMDAIDTMVSKLFFALCHFAVAIEKTTATHECDDRFMRILERIECQAHRLDEQIVLDGRSYRRGYFSLDKSFLEKLRAKYGWADLQVDPVDLTGLIKKQG